MQFRYSTGTSNPTTFPWEAGIPSTPFWDSFSFSQAACILKALPPPELEQYDLDARYGSSASQPEKLAVILDILQEKVKHEEARYTLPERFHTADHPLYSRLLLAIASVNVLLGQTDKAEDAYRTLVAKRKDESDLVPVYNLSGFLIHDGTASKIEEGLELAGPCVEWLDKKLGRASPQAIGVRRNIAEAEWKLGRRERADEMIKEVYDCIDELKGTKFAVYEDDEREFAREWEKGLRE
ncbi:hypothetical protein AbraIFM66950_004104 [Aspergillus brasiliensis]|nr:hypothetical protein AbraIFM66950_004104 [Aspergillus brasiliensis]